MKHGSAYTAANPRRDSLYQSSLIAAKTVTLIGLGGGGEIALQLLRSGVEKFHFIDFDTLDAGNLIRHVCGSEYVGRNKAEAVAELLAKYPEQKLETIHAHAWDIIKNQQEFGRIVEESDLVIVATDNDNSRYFAGEVCQELGKPAIFVSMFAQGSGGEVFIQKPGEACFGCFTRHQNRTQFLQEYLQATNKSDCSSSRDVHSMPGLGIDQSFLCSLAARKALDILLEGSGSQLVPLHSQKNWIVFSLFGITGALEEHLSSLVFNLPRHSDCECMEE